MGFKQFNSEEFPGTTHVHNSLHRSTTKQEDLPKYLIYDFDMKGNNFEYSDTRWILVNNNSVD